jgi:hypothetical protein
VAAAATAVAVAQRGNGGSNTRVDADGTTHIGAAELQAQIDALPLATLTAEQEAGLAHMREEEKLAYDVYTAMYDQWQLKPFSNISSAEQTHSDAMKVLLDRYGLDDPAAGNAAGVFTDPDLQALYDSLIEQAASRSSCATVGATIEDLDDLQSLTTTTPTSTSSRPPGAGFAPPPAGLHQAAREEQFDLHPAYHPGEYGAIIAGEMEQGHRLIGRHATVDGDDRRARRVPNDTYAIWHLVPNPLGPKVPTRRRGRRRTIVVSGLTLPRWSGCDDLPARSGRLAGSQLTANPTPLMAGRTWVRRPARGRRCRACRAPHDKGDHDVQKAPAIRHRHRRHCPARCRHACAVQRQRAIGTAVTAGTST